jgi:uncharacterized protein involved in exopolysaccharide biosynthesis
MNSSDSSRTEEREITLREIIGVLWAGKWLIAGLSVFLAVTFLCVAWVLPKQYAASVIISPVTSSASSSQLSSLGSQLGGLASLAGISVGNDSKRTESVAVLQSDSVTASFISSNKLLPVIFHDKWDSAKGQWIVSNASQTPTLWKATDYFKKNIRTVSTDPKTGLVTLTITWTDPVSASNWANGLVKLTNDDLRDQAIQEAERDISYLNLQAAQTDVVGVKQAIYALMQNEMNKAMMARGSDAFALKVIDPAVPAERATSPRRGRWAVGGFFLGLILTIFGLLIRKSWAVS